MLRNIDAEMSEILTIYPHFQNLAAPLGSAFCFFCNCPGSPFAGVKSTCTGRKTMDFQHLNGALAYHYRAKRAYFGQYRDGFSISQFSLAIDLSSKGLPGQLQSKFIRTQY